MSVVSDKALLERVAMGIRRPGLDAPPGVKASILAQAALSYGTRPLADEATIPSGFDPEALALFEAVVEAAFLVAKSDGHFDELEQAAFESVVVNACGNVVGIGQLHALLADLGEQLAEDGVSRRTKMIARTITRPDQRHDVLRIAALMAHISGGVDSNERHVLEQLASDFQLGLRAVEDAMQEASAILSLRPPSA